MLITGLFSIGLKGLTLALRFVFVVLLVKAVPTDEYGLFTLLSSIATIFVFATGLEFHTYATRRFAALEDNGARQLIIQRHFQIDCLLVPIGLALGMVGIWAIGRLSSYNLYIVCTLLVAEFAATELNRYVIILRHNIAANVANFARLSLWMPAAYMLVSHPQTTTNAIDTLASCWLAGDAVAIVICLWTMGDFRKHLRFSGKFDWRFLLEGVITSRWYYGVAIFALIRDQADRLIIQAQMGTSELAVYGVLQNFGSIMQGFVQAGFIAIYLPRLIEAFARQDLQKEKQLARSLYLQVVGLCLAMSFGIYWAAPFIVKFIGRPEFMGIMPLLLPVLLVQTILAFSCVSHIVLYARHRDRTLFWIDLLSGGFILGLNLILITRFGMSGAVATQFLVITVVAAIKFYISRKDNPASNPVIPES